MVVAFGGSLHLINLANGEEPAHSERQPPITALALHPAQNELAAGSQSGVQVFSWPELKPLRRLESPLAQIHDLAFDSPGTRLLVAGGAPAESGEIQVLDWPSMKSQLTLSVPDDVAYRVRWSLDERSIAAACGDSTCRIFDASSGAERLVYRGHSRTVLALAPLGGQRLESDDPTDGDPLWVSGGVDVTLRIWNGRTGHTLRTLDNHVAPIQQVAWRQAPTDVTTSKQPVWLASLGEDRTVRLWQPLIGRLVRFAKLPSVPRAMTWSTDGARLFVACNDGEVRELDFDTLEVSRTWPGGVGRPHELLVDREARHLVVAGERGLQAITLAAP